MVFLGAILLLLIPYQLLAAVSAAATPPASPTMIDGPSCPASCGNFSVPYPFGLTLNCSIAQDFNLSCDQTVNPPRISMFGMKILEILVGKGQLRVTTGQDLINGGTWMTTGHYSVGAESAVLNWVVDHLSCEDAVKNVSRYACVGGHTVCHTDINATFGYHCECSPGFEGNPYVSGGCQDINECLNQSIICYGNCINSVGNYSCICPPGTRGDPNQGPCLPGQQRSFVLIGVIIGVSAGLGGLLIFASVFCFFRRWKQMNVKKLKHKHFHQNRGLLLQQLISSSNEDIAERTKIFSLEELEKATNKFEESRILGSGGHGTVYKGILSDQRVVAIKKSKIAVQREIDQFINEVAILSQIKHRNVVKLFGCCLETQVPLLVYEFVSNGTLSDHLHDRNSSLSWGDRLRIAAEAAAALSYLHSAASISIFHRDVKTSNILLDDACTAKVSDFGASRSIPLDQTRVTTMVQGTFGYLDPEYFHTGQLTEKSDVYSFGVILLELLSGEKAVSLAKFNEERNLVTQFMWLLSENRLFELIEDQIMEEGRREDIEAVAKLAETCLRLQGEERPTMKDVERHLDALRKSKRHQQHPWTVPIHEESKSLVRRLPKESRMTDSSRQYSLEEEYLLSVEYPR